MAVSSNHTIAAVSTASGAAAISVVRMSGPDALKIAETVFRPSRKFESHRLYYGRIIDPALNDTIDEVMIAVMLSPKSYTGEDMAEIYCHGGMLVTSKVLELLLKNGATAAEPGEFTKRAYLNGKIDLLRAEAVNEVINAKTELALKIAQRQLRGDLSKRFGMLRKKLLLLSARIEVAIDHPDDGYFSDYKKLYEEAVTIKNDIEKIYRSYELGLRLREGFRIVIVGKPNVGKSTLFNRLLGIDRAIVASIPGTTRDSIDAQFSLSGKSIKLTDTAGIRESAQGIEKIGIARSWNEAENADLILWVIDRSSAFDDDDKKIYKQLKKSGRSFLAVLNKQDKASVFNENISEATKIVTISAKNGSGMDMLKKEMANLLEIEKEFDSYDIITTVRQKNKLSETLNLMDEMTEHIKEGYGEEIIGADILSVISYLDEFIGKISNDDLLETVFSTFCVGK